MPLMKLLRVVTFPSSSNYDLLLACSLAALTARAAKNVITAHPRKQVASKFKPASLPFIPRSSFVSPVPFAALQHHC